MKLRTWFSRTFLASVGRRLWLAWIVGASMAGLAIANTTPVAGLVVVLIVGFLPGWLVLRASEGTFGQALQEHAHHAALKRAQSPLLTVGLLIAGLAFAGLVGPAAVHFLVGFFQNVMHDAIAVIGGVVMLVAKLIYAAVVLVVGAAVIVALGSALTSKPMAGARRDQMAKTDWMARFRHEYPPVRKR